MSLINKMLNDLEKRDASLYERQNIVTEGLYSAYDLELSENRKGYSPSILCFTICLIVALSFAVYYYFSDDLSQYNSGNNVPLAIHDVPETIEENIEHNTKSSISVRNIKNTFLKLDNNLLVKSIGGSDSEFASNSTLLNRVDDIYFEVNEQGVNLVMKMPYDIDYLIYGLNNPNRVVIEINNAELGFLLEKLEPVEPIVAIRYSINKEDRFKLVLESEHVLNIRKSITSKNNGAHDLVVVMEAEWESNTEKGVADNALIDIVEQQVEPQKDIVFKGELVKSPVNKDTNTYAEKLFKQAYNDYKAGDIAGSLKKLNMALDQDSSHVNARSTLALILSKQGHTELAYSVLNEGLIQFPEKSAWIKMMARLLLNEGKVVEAKQILSKHTPDITTNIEYYALYAAVLQKLNGYNESAKIYRDLLRINPSKSVWWMGLGISLESLRRYDDALYAYQKAYKSPSLALDSKEFLTQRITMLSNLIKDEST